MSEQCGMRTVGLPHVWTWDRLGQKCRHCGIRPVDEGRPMSRFASDPTVEQLTHTPCCNAPVRLSEREFAHVGRPTKAERTRPQFTTWTVICPKCDRWLHVSYETKLRARLCVGSYSTYRRIVGAPLWRDMNDNIVAAWADRERRRR